MTPRFCFALSLSAVLTASGLHAADPNNGEAKLREALRSTMLQLRDAQSQAATAQAAQVEAEEKNKELAGKLDELAAQTSAERAVTDKQIAELKEKAAGQETQIGQLEASLGKWQAAHKEAAALAGAKEAARAKLSDEVVGLQRLVEDQRRKNAEMFKIGSEILVRYEKFGLGTALTAREPFVGITRVKLQNLVQDYQDKLVDQKIKP